MRNATEYGWFHENYNFISDIYNIIAYLYPLHKNICFQRKQTFIFVQNIYYYLKTCTNSCYGRYYRLKVYFLKIISS